MNVDHVILGRPWLFDLDVTLWRRSNTCTFTMRDKRLNCSQIIQRPGKPKGVGSIKKGKGAQLDQP